MITEKTEKKLVVGTAANIQIIPINPVILNGCVCLRKQESGLGRWFDENDSKKEFHCHKIEIYDHRQETYKSFISPNGVSITEIIQKPARIRIKKNYKISEKGKIIMISYINLYKISKEEKTDVFFSDIAKQHCHFLKDKKIIWRWESSAHGIWGLVLYQNENILYTDIRRLM